MLDYEYRSMTDKILKVTPRNAPRKLFGSCSIATSKPHRAAQESNREPVLYML